MEEILNVVGMEEYQKALETDVPVLVDFWASWCNPCRMFAPILHEFKEEMGDKIRVVKVDVDANEKIAYELKIYSIPTLLVYKNGEIKEKSVGLTSKAGLSEMIIKYL